MSDDYLWDRSGTPDPDVARLEKLLAPLAHDALLDELRMRRRRWKPWLVIGIAVAAAAAVTLFFAFPDHTSHACRGSAGFAFRGVGGGVSCDGATLASGVLPVGGKLDTGPHEAALKIADIGLAKLGPHTRVRLDRTGPSRHQLTLDQGRMHAHVIAVPRLFAVATKHAEIVDLGCEYTVEVDATGVGQICVETGLVELGTKTGAVVVAPRQTCAAILAGQRPGLPVGNGANERVRAAVRDYDAGKPEAFAALLAAAEDPDAITLIALATVDQRAAEVLERLMALSPPPDDEITVESALADPTKLAVWRQDIVEIYIGAWAPKAPAKKEP